MYSGPEDLDSYINGNISDSLELQWPLYDECSSEERLFTEEVYSELVLQIKQTEWGTYFIYTK